jgi:hypothetical protein
MNIQSIISTLLSHPWTAAWRYHDQAAAAIKYYFLLGNADERHRCN